MHSPNLLYSVIVSSELNILTWRKQGGSQSTQDSQETNQVHKVLRWGHLSSNIL